MQISMLSVLTIILTILNCHGLINLDWLIIFAPAIIDLFICLVRLRNEIARRAAVREIMGMIMNEEEDDEQ